MTKNIPFSTYENKVLKEEYKKYTHQSGLDIYIFPKKMSTSYALFGVKYGSLNNKFKLDGEGEYITIPEEIEIQENTLVGVRDLATGECKVKVQESETQEKVAEETKETVASSKGDTIISTAMQYLGTPYVYGGSSLTKGTDCSGFTQGVMKLNGITIPRTSKQQSQTGQLVSKNDMKPGDLLFFGSSKSSIFHTGIYIGNGQMIHASTAKSGGVIIANAFTGGGAPLQVIRRVH